MAIAAFTSRHRYALIEIGTTVLILLAVWAVMDNVDSYVTRPVGDILARFQEAWLFANVMSDVVPSLIRLATGYGAAVVVGVAGGVLLGLSPALRMMAQPTVSFLRSMPAVALIPPTIVLFGIDTTQKAFVIAFMCCWPILLNTADGVAELDGTVRSTARAYGIRGLDRLRFVVLPAAAPRIFAGMRMSLSWALLLLVVSEMIGSTNGVGHFIIQAQFSFALDNMWAGILLLGMMGYVLNASLVMIERRVLRWHVSTRTARG
ncbi:MAG: ABC transporter permease [Solirubrobacteraceae bacterium]|nr:ABC transporter permease [Solirubrobacteraceae bacterium]